MQTGATFATMPLFEGASNTSDSGSAPESIAGFVFLSPAVCRRAWVNTIPLRGEYARRLSAVTSARRLSKTDRRQKAMRATKPKPTSTQKPNLQVIPGALSLYRVGDVITFTLDGIEFDAPIDAVEFEDGRLLLWVTPTVGVPPSHVRRVERRCKL